MLLFIGMKEFARSWIKGCARARRGATKLARAPLFASYLFPPWHQVILTLTFVLKVRKKQQKLSNNLKCFRAIFF